MKAYLQLTLAQLRLFSRNRQVLFWSLFFPIIFMVMLGSLFGSGSTSSLKIFLVDQDQSAASKSFVAKLQETKSAKIVTGTETDQALKDLKHGENELIVVIPKGYETALTKPIKEANAHIQLYYDETNLTTKQTGEYLLNAVVDNISKEKTDYKPIVTVQSEGVQSLNLQYIDFLVPGIVAMMIMSNNLNGVAGQIASWRERGILRRLQSTPLHAYSFIAAQITARLILNASQATIVLLVANLVFHTQVRGSWALLLMFVLLGTLTFMSIGFIIASLARTPESAGPIAGIISFPMLFLGGLFFPINNMPNWVQTIIKLFPIAHLSTSMRQVMNVGEGLATLWPQALLLGSWMVVAFVISSFTFKWE
ncbi:MAG: transporter permease [Bacilli bacterium]|jgi:ABC-2 type transport system permease protein|nr:transporter permease [Bacilli bacterium]